MFRRSYFNFYFILFIGLGALTFWLDKVTKPLSTETGTDFLQLPDYIIEDLSGLRIDHNNTVHRVFHAKKMFHYLSQDLTQLEQVYFINTKPEKPPFRVYADHAEIHGNGEDIFLNGNVTVMRGDDDNKGKITMKTDTLHLIPDEDMAKTDKNVTISRMNTTIHATGLQLDNQTGMIELLSRVRAVDR
ncbi:MAG TPA: LPS export ABC transporter periplasmic protein LptC [Nitrosomonas sp.]|uniref:LPS export ABC transporter periplasmic protein LptC n=1 Tax=Nitrosomonas sp. TaxID=42353 RepID=UPI000E7E9D6D|nr:LPS export ABC transporter periplasmic protein LptC [Nitrosomonas sp.]GJL74075.1 MAG: lipopolysaccharide export system protein LptC [Nitrosomonas sp.]HBV20416.1 LPS export ABC transporter periplasmic protein LptC [Nitrosomonas sp.]HNP26114.1 LPS export ABC transporter periplasmic protein LptC [Nitrosomonas sp.]